MMHGTEQNRHNLGFTLVEMLIVVAIIAILIAVSIPMVNSSQEKARDATDMANERAAKAMAAIVFMEGGEAERVNESSWVDNYPHNTGLYLYDAEAGKLLWVNPWETVDNNGWTVQYLKERDPSWPDITVTGCLNGVLWTDGNTPEPYGKCIGGHDGDYNNRAKVTHENKVVAVVIDADGNIVTGWCDPNDGSEKIYLTALS